MSSSTLMIKVLIHGWVGLLMSNIFRIRNLSRCSVLSLKNFSFDLHYFFKVCKNQYLKSDVLGVFSNFSCFFLMVSYKIWYLFVLNSDSVFNVFIGVNIVWSLFNFWGDSFCSVFNLGIVGFPNTLRKACSLFITSLSERKGAMFGISIFAICYVSCSN